MNNANLTKIQYCQLMHVRSKTVNFFFSYLIGQIRTAAWVARCSQINFDFSFQKICKNWFFSRFTSFNFNLMLLVRSTNRLAHHVTVWRHHLYPYHPYFEPIKNHSVHSQSNRKYKKKQLYECWLISIGQIGFSQWEQNLCRWCVGRIKIFFVFKNFWILLETCPCQKYMSAKQFFLTLSYITHVLLILYESYIIIMSLWRHQKIKRSEDTVTDGVITSKSVRWD